MEYLTNDKDYDRHKDGSFFGNYYMINERSKEFDILLGAKLQKIIIGDNETILRFDNGRTLTTLLSINVGDTKIETKADLMCGFHNDVPTPKKCDHKWGTDGQHSNIFCKKCFISEEEYEKKLEQRENNN